MLRVFLFSFLLFLLASSCGDDTPSCTTETIVGTYTGSTTCDDPSIEDGPITYTVTSLGGDNYKFTDQDGDDTNLQITGCNITIPEVEIDFFGINIKTSGGGTIDGDNLNMSIVTNADGTVITCLASTVKQ